jgi:hypothetical protein
MPETISGNGGHQALWAVTQVVIRGFSLSDEQARPILEEYSRRGQPAWSEKELAHKIKQAREKSRLPFGYILDRADGRASTGTRMGQEQTTTPQPPTTPEPWDPAIPLGGNLVAPPFPVECLPGWLAAWVRATAQATQTPPDLAAMLALPICGAALAKTPGKRRGKPF